MSSASPVTRSLYRKILRAVNELMTKNPTFAIGTISSSSSSSSSSSDSPSEKQACAILNTVFCGLFPPSSVLEYCYLKRDGESSEQKKLIQKPLNAVDVAKILFRDCVERQKQQSTTTMPPKNFLPYGFESARRLKITQKSFLIRDAYFQEIKSILSELKQNGTVVIMNSEGSYIRHEDKRILQEIKQTIDGDFLELSTKQRIIATTIFKSLPRFQQKETEDSIMIREAKASNEKKMKNSSLGNSSSTGTATTQQQQQQHEVRPEDLFNEPFTARKRSKYPEEVLCSRNIAATSFFDLPSIFSKSKINVVMPSPLDCIAIELAQVYTEMQKEKRHQQRRPVSSSSSSAFRSKLSKYRREQLEKEEKEEDSIMLKAIELLEERLFGQERNLVSLQEQFANNINNNNNNGLSLQDPIWPMTMLSPAQRLPLPPEVCLSVLKVCTFQRDSELDDAKLLGGSSSSSMNNTKRSNNKTKKMNTKQQQNTIMLASSPSSSSPAPAVAPLIQDGAVCYDMDSFKKLVQKQQMRTMLPVATPIVVTNAPPQPQLSSTATTTPEAEAKSTTMKKENEEINNNNDADPCLIRVSCSAQCLSRKTTEEIEREKQLKLAKWKSSTSESEKEPKSTNKQQQKDDSPRNDNNSKNTPASKSDQQQQQKTEQTQSSTKPLHPFLEKLRQEKLAKQKAQEEEARKNLSPQETEQEKLANFNASVIESAIENEKKKQRQNSSSSSSSSSSSTSSFLLPEIVQNHLAIDPDFTQQDPLGQSAFHYKVRIENISKHFAILCLSQRTQLIDFGANGSVTETCSPGLVGYMPLIGPSSVTSFQQRTELTSLQKGGVLLGKIQCIAVPYSIVRDFESKLQQLEQKIGQEKAQETTDKMMRELLENIHQERDAASGAPNSGFQFEVDYGPIHLNPTQPQLVALPPSIQDLVYIREMNEFQEKQKKREEKKQQLQQQQQKKQKKSDKNSKNVKTASPPPSSAVPVLPAPPREQVLGHDAESHKHHLLNEEAMLDDEAAEYDETNENDDDNVLTIEFEAGDPRQGIHLQNPDDAGIQMIFDSAMSSSNNSAENEKNSPSSRRHQELVQQFADNPDVSVTEISLDTDEDGNIVASVTNQSNATDEEKQQAEELAKKLSAPEINSRLKKVIGSSSSNNSKNKKNKNENKNEKKNKTMNKSKKNKDKNAKSALFKEEKEDAGLSSSSATKNIIDELISAIDGILAEVMPGHHEARRRGKFQMILPPNDSVPIKKAVVAPKKKEQTKKSSEKTVTNTKNKNKKGAFSPKKHHKQMIRSLKTSSQSLMMKKKGAKQVLKKAKKSGKK